MKAVDEALSFIFNEKAVSDEDKKLYRQAAGRIFQNMLDQAGEDKKDELSGKQGDIEDAFYGNMLKMAAGEL
jgi:hypothetical protein